MQATNGHGPKNAILYARVSTDEQVRTGYSLRQQIERLRDLAASEGYEVLEEVTDPGQSGASLERPGMDRLRDLVSEGGVSIVLAQDRDRFSREPAYHFLLKREFEEQGCKIRALNDQGDDSPEGELTDGILDQLAKYERAKISERTRRGKLRKAKEGKITATMKPPYGFRYNAARDGLDVYPPEMAIVARVFRWAADGLGTTTIQRRLYDQSVLAPTGGRMWSRAVIKRMVMNDIHRPHTYDEMAALVSPEVAATLDPAKMYGIRWWNRSNQTSRHVSEVDGSGQRRYRTRRGSVARDSEEWVAVPVLTSGGLCQALVDRARTMMAAHRAPQRENLARGWELRGVMRCPCGASMSTHTTNNGSKAYYYYRCNRSGYVRSPCRQRMARAESAEAAVGSFVFDLLKDPRKLQAGMEVLIDRDLAEGPRDPVREARAWGEKLAECTRSRRAYQDQQAAGLMTLEELREKLEKIEGTRKLARAELQALRDRRERVKSLKRDRDALLEQMSAIVPDALDNMPPDKRNELYRMLRLEVKPTQDGYAVRGAFCTSGPSPSSVVPCRDRWPCTPPRSPPRRRRAGCAPCRRSGGWPPSCR
jgi:site-specific DNA recombinase